MRRYSRTSARSPVPWLAKLSLDYLSLQLWAVDDFSGLPLELQRHYGILLQFEVLFDSLNAVFEPKFITFRRKGNMEEFLLFNSIEIFLMYQTWDFFVNE